MKDHGNRIVIVCACNDKYAPYCGIMLTSLFHNNQRHQLVVYVLSSDMGTENSQKLAQLAHT